MLACERGSERGKQQKTGGSIGAGKRHRPVACTTRGQLQRAGIKPHQLLGLGAREPTVLCCPHFSSALLPNVFLILQWMSARQQAAISAQRQQGLSDPPSPWRSCSTDWLRVQGKQTQAFVGRVRWRSGTPHVATACDALSPAAKPWRPWLTSQRAGPARMPSRPRTHPTGPWTAHRASEGCSGMWFMHGCRHKAELAAKHGRLARRAVQSAGSARQAKHGRPAALVSACCQQGHRTAVCPPRTCTAMGPGPSRFASSCNREGWQAQVRE